MTKRRTSRAAAPHRCPLRRERVCAPLNQVLIQGDATAAGNGSEAYASCICGRRFALSPTALRDLAAHFGAWNELPRAEAGTLRARALDVCIETSLWPADSISTLSKRGVVPVGVPVLHRETQRVAVLTPALGKLGMHMIAVMREAAGVGLAANQAGVPLRMFVHAYGRTAPQIVVNPEIVHSAGHLVQPEGCLSLALDATHADVERPKVVIARGVLLDGRRIVVRADEALARVFQHEIDHLDGIEYVQRLTGPLRTKVYELIAEHEVDLGYLPLRPYNSS